MADTTERLLLQVDAATELLRRHLTEAEQPLDRFERRADRMADNVDRSIGRMGSKFGAFASLADDAAKRAQASFEGSFSQVQRIAAQAIKGPTVDGRVNLGVDDLRAQAAEAQNRARSFELIVAAAQRTSAAVGDTTQATRLFIQASNASRIEAERQAQTLLAEAGALERVQIELMQSAEAAEHFVGRHQRIAEAAAETERLAQAEALAARTARELASQADVLRAALDPMYVAQKRFDEELHRAEALYAAGTISVREYQAAQDLARATLQAHAAQVSGATERERQHALAIADSVQQERQLALAVQQVRGALDPMYVAQLRFDQEMDRADDLFRRGAITMREYAQAQQLARNNLAAHAQMVAGPSAQAQQLAIGQINRNRIAMQGLGYQAQDTFTQLSMNANLFQVIAIQGAQAAGQMTMMTGKAQAFGNFMLGPWGLAITGGMLVLGALTKNMDLFGTKTEEAVDKLRKDAEETRNTDRAKHQFAVTLDGVRAAIDAQNKALKDSADSERDATERANIAAKVEAERALRIRETTAARLADAVAAKQALDDSEFANTDPRAAAVAKRDRQSQVDFLTGKLKEANDALAQAQVNLNLTRVDLAAEQAQIAIDPVRAVTKLYDDRIKVLKDQQREEANLGRQIGAESKRRLEALEAEKRKAIETAQARVNAERRSGSGNRQFGRDIDEAGARSIIASIGGRVTSGTRTRAQQERIFADAQAGRHAGPVARPGTSAHERGQALDVAYGPGISVASIRKAFEDAGVRLRKILNEPEQRVYHVEWGTAPRRGPSAETMQRREDAARRAILADDSAFTQDFLGARKRLLDATGRSAASEEQREALLREEINAEADAQRTRTGNRLQSGDLTVAQALQLHAVNEATRQQRLANVDADKARRLIEQRYDSVADAQSSSLEVLRIQQDSAVTERDRQRIGREILELEQQLRRQALERVAATSDDPRAVQRARDGLARLPQIEAAENGRFEQQTAGPLDQYRRRVMEVSKDTRTALESIAVQGFGRLEDEGSRATAQAVADLLGLKGVAADVVGSVIQDLARLAIQKAIVASIGGSFFGFADGGRPIDAPGFADGGSPGGLIRGPGGGRSDSILALLAGGKGAIRVSNREFIVNAAATREWLPELAAINSGRLRKFADGGAAGLSTPSLPSLREPRPNMARLRSGARDRVDVQVRTRVEPSPLLMAQVEETTIRTVAASADPIAARASDATMRRLSRPRLPGAWD
ncbi:hypothetical protein [Sphingomonas sp. 2378]|uniref:hypothetical protein n=1 Tax=Sphingomonas sp. 2378 TaxID=1219748 RepID=UPI00311B0F22